MARFGLAGLGFVACLSDRFARHAAQVFREADLRQRPHEPLGRIEVEPADPVAIVGAEPVVEVVVALSERVQGRDEAVAARVRVRVRDLIRMFLRSTSISER